MNKLFTLLCAMLLTVQFAAAQQHLFVIAKNDNKTLSVYPDIASVSFSDDFFSFTFTYGTVKDLTSDSFNNTVRANVVSDKINGFEIPLELGVCYSDTKEVPTLDDSCQVLGSILNQNRRFYAANLTPGATCYYRGYAKVNGMVFYGDVAQVKLVSLDPGDKIINGHKFIDLGLPSGLLWAETNVGAETDTDYGSYYTWGETATKEEYTKKNDKYTSYSGAPTKYSKTDSLTELEDSDDVAYVNWGSSCHMPSKADIEELINYCTWTWGSKETSAGTKVNGLTVTSKTNGKTIFLPAAGYYDDEWGITSEGDEGYYWSKDLASQVNYGRALKIYDSFGGSTSSTYRFRYLGNVVRPVAKP